MTTISNGILDLFVVVTMRAYNKCISRITNLLNVGISIPKGTLIAKSEIADEKSLAISNVMTILNFEIKTSIDSHIETRLSTKLGHLTNPGKKDFIKMLLKNKEIFNYESSDNLKAIKDAEAPINTDNHPPYFVTPYRIPQAQRPIVDKLIHDQLKN